MEPAAPLQGSRSTSLFPMLLWAALLALAAPAHAGAGNNPEFKLRAGVEYTTGDYGTGQDTDILYVPFAAELALAGWSFSVTVPYIQITGTGEVVGGAGPPIVLGTGQSRKPAEGQAERSTESGLGDILAAVAYRFNPAPQWLIGLTGEVKFPTADKDKGLGTGEFDYTVKVDVARKIGRLTPFGAVGYRFVGDDDFDLDDALLASVGASYELSPVSKAGLVLDYIEASVDTADDALKLLPYLTWDMTTRWAFDLYGIFGLTDGSPDYGGGLRLGYRL